MKDRTQKRLTHATSGTFSHRIRRHRVLVGEGISSTALSIPGAFPEYLSSRVSVSSEMV